MRKLIIFLLMLCASTALAQTQIGGGGGGNGSAGTNSLGAAINVKGAPYNAVGNGKFFVDGATNGSNNQLTSATAVFAASDVNQIVWCISNPLNPAAGLWTPGQTTVASFINSSTITYSGSNAGARSGMYCVLGSPSDPAAILAAFNACKSTFNADGGTQLPFQSPPCNIYLPQGIYILSNTLNNLISTGLEGCVGIIGDGQVRSILIPTPTFTAVGNFVINDRCTGILLRDFTVEAASVPINMGGTAGVIRLGGQGSVQDVAVYDHLNSGPGTLFGFLADTGTNINIRHPTVISSGSTGQGGLSIGASQTVTLAPFLSNTTNNLTLTCGTGANGAGQAIFGGVVDEGSIVSFVNCVDAWVVGTTLTGGANCVSVDATSYVWLTGGYCGTFGGNTGGGPTVASGGHLNITQTHVNAINAGSACYTSLAYGGIIDDGTNRCTISGGGTIYQTGDFINQTSLTHSTFNAFQTSTLAVGTVSTWQIDQPIAVGSLSWTPSNAAACTAASFPVMQLTDGTVTLNTSASDTFVNGAVTHTFDNKTDVIFNAAAAATDVIQLKVNSIGTCGTAPTNVNFNIQWQATAPSL